MNTGLILAVALVAGCPEEGPTLFSEARAVGLIRRFFSLASLLFGLLWLQNGTEKQTHSQANDTDRWPDDFEMPQTEKWAKEQVYVYRYDTSSKADTNRRCKDGAKPTAKKKPPLMLKHCALAMPVSCQYQAGYKPNTKNPEKPVA